MEYVPQDSFVVLMLHRDDIYEEHPEIEVDFDDADMRYIAEKVGSILTEQCFWDALESVVDDYLVTKARRGD